MPHRFSKFISYLLYGTLFLPLLFTPFTFFPHNYGKTVIFQIFVEAVVFLWLAGVAFANGAREGVSRDAPTPWFKKINCLDWSILIFLIIITFTAFTGVNTSNSWWGNQTRANGVLTWWHFGAWYFLVKKFLLSGGGVGTGPATSAGRRDLSLQATVAVAGIVALTIIFERYLPASLQSGAGGGIIGNRAFASSYLVLAAGLAVYLAAEGAKRRWAWIAAASALVGTVVAAGNRGSFVGLFFGLGAAVMIGSIFLPRGRVRFGARLTLALGAICLASLLWLSQQSAFIQQLPRIASFFNIAKYTGATSQTRMMAWKIAGQGIQERPALGWGWGNYDVVFNKYYNPGFLRYSFLETVWDKPHNWLLEIGVSSGVFGVLAYLGILGTAVFYLIRFLRKDRQRALQAIILCGIVVAALVQNLFLFETTSSLLLWFLILGIVSSTYVIVIPTDPELAPRGSRGIPFNQLSENGSPSTSSWQVLGSARDDRKWIFRNSRYAVIPIGLLITGLIIHQLQFLRSSYYLRQARAAIYPAEWARAAERAIQGPWALRGETGIFLAERFTQLQKADVNLTSAEVARTAVNIADNLERSAEKYPDNPLFRVWAGQIYMALGESVNPSYYPNAERNLRAAAALSPAKQDMLFLLGRLYLLEKKFPEALEVQRRALAADPAIGTAHWFMGISLIASGQLTEGLKEIEEAMAKGFALSPEQKLHVVSFYTEAKQYDTVIAWYTDLRDAEPENVSWYVKLAEAYALAGRKEEALATARQIVSMYPQLQPEAEKFIKQYKLEK